MIHSIDKTHGLPSGTRTPRKDKAEASKLERLSATSAESVHDCASSVLLNESVDHFNLRSFDLNLMLVFDALMKERSVTKAASRLRIQQPAMSHSLSTLRLLLQDELFVRVGQTMRPTPRANALAEGVNEVLAQAHRLLLTSQPFDPGKEERIFRIGFSSELEVILMPPLAEHLHQHAHGIRVHARAAAPESVFQMLDDHVIDFAVGCYPQGTSRFRRKELFQQSLSCCYNPELLKFPHGLTATDYLEARHALVSQKQEIEGCLDDALRKLNVRLEVAMAAPEFLTILTAVGHTPFLATLPTRIAKRYAQMFSLTVCEVPIDLEVAPIAMVWTAHADKEPAFAWIREQIYPVITAARQVQ
jgi:LysR family transcriptional regulator, mexEF-oprN operon transcriptional activator